MKNLFVSVFTHSVCFSRRVICPAKVLFAHVACAPSSLQFLFYKNGKTAQNFGLFKKAHAFFGLTALVVLVSLGLFGSEATSLAYRSAPVAISGSEVITELVAELPAEPELLRNSHILVSSADELIRELKQEKLWHIEKLDRLPNVLVSRFPADLSSAAVPDKKRAFIVSVLPAAMVVLDEVRQERQQLLNILDALGGDPSDLVFSKIHPAWLDGLGENNVEFIERITAKYRTENAEELLNRVNVLPLSLIVAQGAIESSWGSSRFATQANNLFGMWTWGEKGLIPLRRDPGKTHRIALYDSIVDSVRAYVLTINRVSAYDSLRQIRQQTLDPYSLSEGLLRYSERKELYVDDVKRVIQVNNLKNYDGISFSAT